VDSSITVGMTIDNSYLGQLFYSINKSANHYNKIFPFWEFERFWCLDISISRAYQSLSSLGTLLILCFMYLFYIIIWHRGCNPRRSGMARAVFTTVISFHF